MKEDPPPPATSTERAQLKQWLDTWSRVGPLLEQERWARLRAMSREEIDRDVLLVLGSWQTDWTGDNGDELLRHQAVFSKARRSGHA
ncbi:MAG TPA: hypothetical protein VFX12_05390 [Vicinamibacterales bacterium]|nr:hypothetical protein [Vicinamibacterales bacterium]